MSNEIEQTLRDGLDRMIDLVGDGLEPTEALRKVAADDDLLPDTIRTLGTIYNNSASVVHIRENEDVFTKAADHPLADPEQVINESFRSKTAGAKQRKRKVEREELPSDEYAFSPEYNSSIRIAGPLGGSALLDDYDRSRAKWHPKRHAKQACDNKSNEPQLPEIPKDNSPLAQARFRKALGPFRKEASDATQAMETAKERLHRALYKVAAYFDHSQSLPWGEVVEQTEVMFGKVASIVLKHVEARYAVPKRPVPRYFRLADPKQAPYSLIQDAVAKLDDFDKTSAESVRANSLCRSLENEELMRNSTPDAPQFSEDDPPYAKTAFDLGGLLSGAAGGAMTNLQGMGGNPDRARERLSEQIDDPVHLSQLRSIKAMGALNEALTDPRLKAYPRIRLVDAYNQIADVAPKVAERGTLLAPYMHRVLVSGGLDGFDSKALVDVEYNLKRIGMPGSKGMGGTDEENH